MVEQLDILKHLQTVDLELYQLRKQQRQKPQELEQIAAQVAEQEAKLKEIEERFKAHQMAHKEKEIELQTREANVKKLQGQLFQVKTNKEYTAMQKEIDGLKADNSLLEEGILATLELIDQSAAQRKQQQQLFAEEQGALQKERQRIERELAEIEERINQLEQKRNEVAKQVVPESLAVYERVLKTREGVALVALMDESCGGCHRRLPPQVVNQVYLKAGLVTCESCNRILYSDEA